MLSICTTVKDRSRVNASGRELQLFPNCVESIRQSVDDHSACELIVADWQSEDWPLHEWLIDISAPLTTRIISLDGTFSRGRGLNIAAKHAKGDVLLFLDADVLVSSELLRQGQEYVRRGNAFFPVVYSYDDPLHQTGHWRHDGYGICMIAAKDFHRSRQWPEFNSWGQEDEDFYDCVSSITNIARETVAGFYHQWHPNSIQWKNRYGTEPPRLGREGERIRDACNELNGVLPKGESFILVDEDRFCLDLKPLERSIPFTERNGEYWGPPPDDETAIRELTRMNRQGVRFLAVAWIGFWWLDYYSKFREFVRSNSICIRESPNILVFDMGVVGEDRSNSSSRRERDAGSL